jgi:hypothetical protein
VALAFQESGDLPRHLLPAGYAAAPREKPFGTGHATLAARQTVQEPFAVINADDFYGRESFSHVADFLRQPGLEASGCRSCLVAFTLRQTLSAHGKVARGICLVTPQGTLDQVEELTDLTKIDGRIINRPREGAPRFFAGDELVSMNMWGFLPSIFPQFEQVFARFLITRGHDPSAEFYIPYALDQLIHDGREQCRVLRSGARWFGVTYRQDVPEVRSSLRALHEDGTYPASLWQ